MTPDTKFKFPGGEVSGKDIENVLRTLMVNKEAADYAVEKVDMDHRTHQQSFMRLFVFPLMKRWAARFLHNQYDDRNRNTVYFAAQAMSAPDQQEVFPYI